MANSSLIPEKERKDEGDGEVESITFVRVVSCITKARE